MARTVFFSWQSDRLAINGKNLIESALRKAVDSLSQSEAADEVELLKPVRESVELNKDTQSEPGSPPIFEIIRQKLDTSDVLVSDLTAVAQREKGELIPNPNVLVEYGYAYKTLGYSRIIQVMNKAFGEPTRTSMPFDLALHRLPITYDLPDEASEDQRKLVTADLAGILERALRDVLSIAKPQVAHQYREPADGRARFRPPGQALGFLTDPINHVLRVPDHEVNLQSGPAMWLRVGPLQPKGDLLTISEIKQRATPLATLDLNEPRSQKCFIRSSDGCGYGTHMQDGEPMLSVAFIFTDGEIWVVNPWRPLYHSNVLVLNEEMFCTSLRSAADLLSTLSVHGPYRWVVGYEGFIGRKLAVANRVFGTCVSNLIESEGTFQIGQDAKATLKTFFEKVFDQCDATRPQP